MTFDDVHPDLITHLKAAQYVAFRMVLTWSGEQWHIHTLIIEVFPEESRDSWPCYDYNYGNVTFIAGSIPGSKACEWLLSEQGTVSAYTFQRPLQVDFERPIWHSGNMSNDLPAIPWPHTRYDAILSYLPRIDPLIPRRRRRRELEFNLAGMTQEIPRDWPQEELPDFLISTGCPFYADFTTAVYHLMYGQVDPDEALRKKLDTAIIVRVAHVGAWLANIHLSQQQVTVNVEGKNVSNARLQLFGIPDLHYDEILLDACRLAYPFPRGIPQKLWVVLSRDNKCLDYCHINAKWSPFASNQKNIIIEPPDLQIHVQELITQGEGPTIEFKKEIPSRNERFLKTVAAFANGEGGVILLGVEDGTGVIVGIEGDVNREKDKITNTIRNNVVPEPQIRVEHCEIDGKSVMAIFVDEGTSLPYGINPAKPEFYVRRGATTFPARQEEIRVLAQSNNKKSEINHEQ